MGRAYAALGGPLITQCGDTSLFPQGPSITCLDNGVHTDANIQTKTNYMTFSEDLTKFLDNFGTVIKTQTTLEDDSTTATESVYRFITVPNDYSTYAISAFITKSGANNVGVSIRFQTGGVTTNRNTLVINPISGDYRCWDESTLLPVDCLVLDAGSSWRITLYNSNNGTGNTIAFIVIAPSHSKPSAFTGNPYVPTDVTATGVATIQYISLVRVDKSGDDPGRYIPSTGSASTTETNSYYSSSGSINFARSAEDVKSDGISCLGSGVTWQVPPLLF